MTPIIFYVDSPVTRKALRQLALDNDVSMSEMLRRLVMEKLAQSARVSP